MSDKKNILMYVPYNYEKMKNAPMVRAHNIFESLSKFCNVELITGNSLERLLPTIRHFLNRGRFDGIYIEGLASYMGPMDYLLLYKFKRMGIPILPFIRDIYWMYPQTLATTNFGAKIWYKYTEYEMKWYLKNATGLLFPSQSMSDLFDHPNKFLLPPAGVINDMSSHKVNENNDMNILFIGGFGAYSGVNILDKAMEYVVEVHPDAYCTLVGYGNLSPKLKSKKWIRVINDASFHDIQDIISQSYIATIPRPITTYNNFSIPVKLFDYLSCGKPVISTKCVEIDNFISLNEVGIIVDDTPGSFAEGIIYLLDNPSKVKKMGQNALELIKTKHSWDHRAQNLLNIIDTID